MSIAERPIEPIPDDASDASQGSGGNPPPNQRGRLRRWLTERRPEFRVGTLQYTGFSLLMIFIWLLWGDFCYALLEENLPNVLPLKLKEMGAGDTLNAVFNKSLSYTVIFFLAPVVSFRSDRTRTRWGRRIPYLLWSAPFMGLFLILIGCYQEITHLFTGGAAQATFFGYSLSSTTVALIVMGLLIVGSDLAGIFANTVYYYLFNDVVPPAYISRFFAFYRIVGGFAGMAYNAWILPNSMTHFRTIFVIAGVAYIIGFALMCLFVREGQYPPPPPNVDGKKGFVSAVKTYAIECFTHRLYWYFFLANTTYFTSKVVGMFVLIRNTKSLGLTLAQLGTLGAWTAFIAMLLQFPAAWVSDKYHPLRVYVIARIWDTLGTLCACVWIFTDFGPRGNLIYMYVVALTFMPIGLVANAAELPMYMRVLPRDRYGQFCSANAMVRAFVMIFGSALGGAFIGAMEPWWGERRYTWLAGWQLFFQIQTAVFLILLYRQWKLHGGLQHYVPPGVGTDEVRGFEVLRPAAQSV